ncbi:DUF1549 and DUF1553 domain-containing protein [bacterium]|nr:DUF1549 and DUF1553 domain-containing protein [bacterium]
MRFCFAARGKSAGLAVIGMAMILSPSAWLFAEALPAGSYRSRLQELRRERDHERNRSNDASSSASDGQRPDYIDAMVEETWKENGLSATEQATDGEFIRRATLDIVGRIPTLAETKAYLQEKGGDKRSKLVDRLLASDEYGRNFANVWVKLLIPADLVNPRDVNRDALHAWLEREFNRSRPWNEMSHELIAATGRWDENPAVNFILANQDNNNSIRTTSMVTRIFLGVQTQCTECHDHPWNAWKQDQFHGVNAFFVGTREKRATKPGNQQQTDYWTLEEVPFQDTRMKGVFFERRNGLSVFTEPTYLDGRNLKALSGAKPTKGDVTEFLKDQMKEDKPVYLRQVLADAVTAPDNPYFARAMVNRVWYHFLGHSFTKNVDDFDNGLDEPSMPDLLDKLAEDFQANNYDVKKLVHWIATTKTYGLSTKRKGKKSDEAVGFFSFQLTRPLTPEQLYDSVLTLTQIDRSSETANASGERKQFIDEFVRTFSNDDSPTAAPTYDGTITQSLMMMNSPLMNRVTSCVPGSYLHDLIKDESRSDKERIESIYLAALSRRPTSHEVKAIGNMLDQAKDKNDRIYVYSDVLWAVVNSAEFALNH